MTASTAGGPGRSSLSGSVGGAPINALAAAFALLVWLRTAVRSFRAAAYFFAWMCWTALASAASAFLTWVVTGLAAAAVGDVVAEAEPAPVLTATVSIRPRAAPAATRWVIERWVRCRRVSMRVPCL